MPFANSDTLTASDINNVLRGLHRNNASSSVTGSTSETDLSSFTMTGGTQTATGTLWVIAAGTITGAAGTKRIRLYFGTTVIVDTTAAAGTADWWIEAKIFNTASNAQRIVVTWSDHTSATNFNKDYTTAAIDTASNAVVKVTGQLGNAADTITQTMYDIFVVQMA